MTTRWFGKQIPSQTTSRWLILLLFFFLASSGCQHAIDEDVDTDTASSELFVEYERYYDPPQQEYFASDGIRAVNPNPDERLPLVIKEEAQKLSPEAMQRADLRTESNVIRFPRQDFESAADVEPGEIVISGLTGDDFWVRVTAVEVFDETIVWHTQKADFDDVILIGEFMLEVDPGHTIPEDFNMMDIYLEPDVQSHQQALGEDCLMGEVEDMLDNVSAFDSSKEWHFASSTNSAWGSMKTHHHNWLWDQSQKEGAIDLENFDDANNTCTAELGKDMDAARAAYSVGDPNPPSIICKEEYFHDELEKYARDDLEMTDEEEHPIEDICQTWADRSGETDGKEDADEVGSMMEEQFQKETDGENVAFPGPEYGGEYKEDICNMACDFAEDPDSCRDGCSDLEKCIGNFCFEITTISASYSPSFSFGLSTGFVYVEATAGFVGDLELTLGARLGAQYAFNWNWDKDFAFMIPGLSFSLGPFGIGVGVYANFGAGFSFNAEATIEAEYTKVIEAGAELVMRVGSGSGVTPDITFEKKSDNLEFDASGSIEANFQVYAGAGVALMWGFGVASHRLFWVEPIRAVFSASASIAPPHCPYDVGLHVGGEFGWDFDAGIFSFDGTRDIWGPKYLFRWEGDLHEFIDPLKYLCGDDDDVNFDPPVDDGDRIGCTEQEPCDDGYSCHHGECIQDVEDDSQIRATLIWDSDVDLNLIIEDPSGTWHSVSGLVGEEDAFTRYDCGAMCEEQEHMAGQYPFIESAILDEQPGTYRMYVIHNQAEDRQPEVLDSAYNYDLEIEHGDVYHEVDTGTVNTDYGLEELPVVYEYCVPGGSVECK